MVNESLKTKPLRLIALLLALFFILGLAACGGGGGGGGSSNWDVAEGDTFEGGEVVAKPDTSWYNGGPGPFSISNANQLAGLAVLVNNGTDNFYGRTINLTADIDLSAYGAGYNHGKGWTPIATTTRFSGTFNGNGKTISGLYIKDSTLNWAGLFGYIYSGTVKDLGIKDADITGSDYVGGVAGEVAGGSITNSYATGNVTGRSFVGGVAGYVSYNSSVTNSYATGSVRGYFYVGGVAGYVSYYSSVSNSYATGTVSGDGRFVGGVAGYVSYNSSVTNSYATGNVSSGDAFVGGVAGGVEDQSTVSNSYATGNVTGESFVGGVAGDVSYYSSVSNSYATGTVSGNDYGGGVAGYVYSSEVKNCAALSSAVVRNPGSTYTRFGRVAGSNGGSLSNNVANVAMTVMGAATTSVDGTNINGIHVFAGYSAWNFNNQSLYSSAPLFNYYSGSGGLGWRFGANDANPWKWGGATYPLPILYWQTTVPVFPTHLN